MKVTKKAPAKKPASRWSIGVFRNMRGKLVTLYVTADGVPMPYEKKRLNGNKILFHQVITGVKYSAARQRLLKASGLKDGADGNGKKEKKATKAAQ